MKTVLTAFLLVGCGGPSFMPAPNAVMYCDFPGLKRVWAELPVDCGAIESNFWLGGNILKVRNVLSLSDYNEVFKNVTVVIREGGCVDASCQYLGMQHPDKDYPWIEVEWTMASTLHELLHQLDTIHHEPTLNHEHWGEKGYTISDFQFRATITEIRSK